jgi:hypothetical protein
VRQSQQGNGGYGGYRGGRGFSAPLPMDDPYGTSPVPGAGLTDALNAARAAAASKASSTAASDNAKAVAAAQAIKQTTGLGYLYGQTGDYIVSRGYRWAPQYVDAKKWDVRSPDRLDFVVPAVAYTTLKAAKNHWFLMSPQERATWNRIAATGIKIKGKTYKSGQTLWDKMVTESAAYNKAVGGLDATLEKGSVETSPDGSIGWKGEERLVSPYGGAWKIAQGSLDASGRGQVQLDNAGNPVFAAIPGQTTASGQPIPSGFMDPLTFLKWGSQVGLFKGTPDKKKGPRGGGGGGGGGSASSTQTSYSTSVSTAEEAKAIFDNAAQNFLGRNATPNEHEAFLSALNLKERQNPSKTVTEVSVDGSNTTSKSTTTGGVSGDTKMEMGIDSAKEQDDYNDYQMVRYFDMFKNALA